MSARDARRAPDAAQRAAMLDAFARQPKRRASRSYSQFVTAAKYTLPVIALSAIAAIALWPSIEQAARVQVGFAKLDISDLQNSPMLNALFQSTDDDDRPYRVAAIAATPSAVGPDLVELDQPSGSLQLDNGGEFFVSAQTGLFDRAARRLELFGDVELASHDGHALRTTMAMVDLSSGFAEGQTPVDGDGPSGAIVSEGFQVVDGGAIVVFTGRARAVLNAAQEADAP
ncbi:MAG: LPS export ABC transporter periplasmic protein LptC [Pseudomonadota bacterium]